MSPTPKASKKPESADTASPQHLDHFLSSVDLKVQKSKYSNLQDRGLIIISLDKDSVPRIIEVLEHTGWGQSDFGNLMFGMYFYLNDSGFFQFIADLHANKTLEKDDLESLIKVRDKLKPIVEGTMKQTGELLKKHKLKT